MGQALKLARCQVTVNNERLEAFMIAYEPTLREVLVEDALLPPEKQQYGYPALEAPGVALKMRKAFASGSFNHAGKAIARTCRALGIRHTQRAMLAFFQGREYDRP